MTTYGVEIWLESTDATISGGGGGMGVPAAWAFRFLVVTAVKGVSARLLRREECCWCRHAAASKDATSTTAASTTATSTVSITEVGVACCRRFAATPHAASSVLASETVAVSSPLVVLLAAVRSLTIEATTRPAEAAVSEEACSSI